MKLTNAYIIDGDVIEKKIELLKEVVLNATNSDNVTIERVSLNTLLSLKKHLNPARPIVVEAFEAGRKSGLQHMKGHDLSKRDLQDFLTKDFI